MARREGPYVVTPWSFAVGMRYERINDGARAEAHRITGGQTGLVLRLLDGGAGGLLWHADGVEGYGYDRSGLEPPGSLLVDLAHARQWWDDHVVLVDVRAPRLVAEHQQVGRRPMNQAERHCRVCRVD